MCSRKEIGMRIRHRRSIGWAGLKIAVVLATLPFVSAENLSGLAVGSDGKPIAGAFISAVGTSTVPWTNAQTVSGVDGSFSFRGLNTGTYRLCAQVPSGGYLNPCDWSPTPPTLSLAVGRSVTAFVLKIEKGSTLKIRINDPNNLLGLDKTAAPILMAIPTPHGLLPSPVLRAQDAVGSDHEITIPFDTPVQLAMQGNQLKITKDDGTPLSVGSSIPVLQSSQLTVAQPPLVFQLSR